MAGRPAEWQLLLNPSKEKKQLKGQAVGQNGRQAESQVISIQA